MSVKETVGDVVKEAAAVALADLVGNLIKDAEPFIVDLFANSVFPGVMSGVNAVGDFFAGLVGDIVKPKQEAQDAPDGADFSIPMMTKAFCNVRDTYLSDKTNVKYERSFVEAIFLHEVRLRRQGRSGKKRRGRDRHAARLR